MERYGSVSNETLDAQIKSCRRGTRSKRRDCRRARLTSRNGPCCSPHPVDDDHRSAGAYWRSIDWRATHNARSHRLSQPLHLPPAPTVCDTTQSSKSWPFEMDFIYWSSTSKSRRCTACYDDRRFGNSLKADFQEHWQILALIFVPL